MKQAAESLTAGMFRGSMNPLLKFCRQIEWKVGILSLTLVKLLPAPFLDASELALPEVTYLGFIRIC